MCVRERENERDASEASQIRSLTITKGGCGGGEGGWGVEGDAQMGCDRGGQ